MAINKFMSSLKTAVPGLVRHFPHRNHTPCASKCCLVFCTQRPSVLMKFTGWSYMKMTHKS